MWNLIEIWRLGIKNSTAELTLTLISIRIDSRLSMSLVVLAVLVLV